MSRGIDTATAAKLDTKSFNIISLMEFQNIGGVTTYLTDAPTDLTHNGNVYTALGQVLGMTDVQEEEELKIESIDITLSAIDTDLVKLFLDYDYIDRRVLVHRVIMDHDYSFIGTPILIFDGRLDQPRIVEDFQGRTATLAVSASSHWSDFNAVGGRHTNNTEHTILYPGDTFYAPAAETQKDVLWGKE